MIAPSPAATAALQAPLQQSEINRPTDTLLVLATQPVDIIDQCLQRLGPHERASLGQAMPRILAPLSAPHRQMVERIHIANWQSISNSIAAGPYRRDMLRGIDASTPQPPHSDHWSYIAGRKRDKEHDIASTAAELSRQHPGCENQPLFPGFALAVCALDRLNGGANTASRRQAGRDALLMACGFDKAMQETLMGLVVVGTSLAFMGRVSDAENVFNEALKRDIDADLKNGFAHNGLHMTHLIHNLPRFPDRCLVWIWVAAVLSKSDAIKNVYYTLRNRVPHKINDLYFEASSLNARWYVIRYARYQFDSAQLF